MNKPLSGRSMILPVLLGIVLLAAGCRTTVPAPTMDLGHSDKPFPVYSMHNVGPQHVGHSRAVRWADLDMDGHLDLLVGGWRDADGFVVYWGDGKGHWRMQDGPPTSMQPRSLAVADVDMDGIQDVAIAGEGDQKGVQVWSLGPQGWHLQSTPVEGGIYRDVLLSDVNEDGWVDLLAARGSTGDDGGIDLWLNNGRGGWIGEAGPVVAGFYTDIAVADINGDGHQDIAAARRGGLGVDRRDSAAHVVGGIEIWWGDGHAHWQRQLLQAAGDMESLTLADVNGDGRLDILGGMYQQGIVMWLQGASGWVKRKVVDHGTWACLRVGSLKSGEAARRELVAASADGKGLWVWRWQGGDFAAVSGVLPGFGIYHDLDLGDFRGIGELAVAAARHDGAPEVWSGESVVPQKPRLIRGRLLGKPLQLYFDTASAALRDSEVKRLQQWLAALGVTPEQVQWEIEGRADIRPIHNEVFPNNTALSRARGESVAAWLKTKGVPEGKIRIIALGDAHPLPQGADETSLRKNRRVTLRAYELSTVRLPQLRDEQKRRDLFHVQENSIFKTIDGIPGYKVGPGDELSLTFWQGGKPMEHKVTVQVDGTVSLPYQEALQVSGLTPREIDQKITQILSQYEKHPRVDVRVLKAVSKTVSIFGEVQSLLRQPTGPGIYPVRGKETLVDFLSRAGGPSKDADLTKVQVIRHGKTILLNLDRAIKQGDWSENAVLDAGDTIFVPSLAQSKRRVYVLGQVKKPGIVEFTGDIHFLDAVAKSGGFDKDAYYRDIRVVRADRDAPVILPVAFDRFLEGGDLTQNIALQDKDILIIPRSPMGNWNQWVKDLMPTLDLLTKPITTYEEILIIRDLQRRLP